MDNDLLRGGCALKGGVPWSEVRFINSPSSSWHYRISDRSLGEGGREKAAEAY